MQLEPREYFTIVRQLADPFDTDTYYIQAVVRNARTDTTLETVQLTDQGSQRFSKAWQVPADTSGQGFYITVETTVYTDSGYSTKSAAYGIETREYLVQRRTPVFGGGGGGTAVDYRKIQEMIEKAVNEIEYPHTDIEPLMQTIRACIEKIDALPAPERADFAPLVSEMRRAEQSIVSAVKAIPEPATVDLTPVYQELGVSKKDIMQMYAKSMDRMVGDFEKMINKMPGDIMKLCKPHLEEIKSALAQEVRLKIQPPEQQKARRKFNL